MSTFTAAAVQMRSGTDPKRNIEIMDVMVREAAGQGAAYVQTPEMTGCLVRDRAALKAGLRPAESDPVAQAGARLAEELGIHLHIGSTAIAADGGKVANRAFLFSPTGALVATYDKIHMFDVDLDNGESWRESSTYEAGTETVIADLPFARLGLAVCYDLRFPQLFRAQALAGAEVLTMPAAFTRQTGEAHWHVLQRARAIENGAWVISAAQGGLHEDGRETFGHSLIVDPWGRIVAEAAGGEPGIILAEIDTAASAEARKKIPNLKKRAAVHRTAGGRRLGAAASIMISFTLSCEEGHGFDGWFRNNADFDAQSERGLVACPVCGSAKVAKGLMAPAVSTGRKRDQIALAMGAEQKKLMAEMKAMADKVRGNADYVGPSFAEEARKIHFGEVEARGIYGEASPDEARALLDDGIEFMPLPVFPDDRN